ncbi:MAG: YebC/PmpR family DNA-binding transcriptional regulator [Polyangiales bacterium]
MSGHSRWSTIKHKKAASDAKKGKTWTKVIKEITVAARMGGGDPNGNPRLRKAVDLARSENMPTDNIAKAIKRGTGELEGITYDEVTYEGTGPGGTLFIVESLTDNRNRTVAELRKMFEKNNAVLGTSGTASWAFDRRGQIRLEKKAASEEQLFDVALGAGADDIADEGEEWLVSTPPTEVDVVRNALEAAKIESKSAQIVMVPKNAVQVEGRDAEQVLRLVELLDDHDDVQNVFANFDVSDEEMARISGE